MCLSETWMTQEALHMPFAKLSSSTTVPATTPAGPGRPSGGIAVFFNPRIYTPLLTIRRKNFLGVKLKHRLFTFILISVYIPPKKTSKEKNQNESNLIVSQDFEFENFLSDLDKLLLDFNQNEPDTLIVIGGDFNSRIGNLNSLQIDLSTNFLNQKRISKDLKNNKRGLSLVSFLEEHDQILLNGRACSDNPADFTYVSERGRSVVDLVWCSFSHLPFFTDLEIADWPTRSDHSPAILYLGFESFLHLAIEKQEEPDKLRWSARHADHFREAMRWRPEVAQISHDVDQLNSTLISTIFATSSELGMLHKPQCYSRINEPWFDTECQAAKKKIKHLLSLAKKTEFDSGTVSDYENAKKSYSSLIKSKKEIFTNRKIESISLARDSIGFWRAIRSSRQSLKITSPINLPTWTDYLIQLFPPRLNSIPLTNTLVVPLLHAEITVDEVLDSINSCKSNKAPGEDGINYDFYKNLPDNWILFLTHFFNAVLNLGEIPTEWSRIIIFTLYKKGDNSDPGNYRFISLINCVTKIFMQILLKRLQKFCDANELLPEFQSGFRRKRSCLDNVFTLNSLIQLNTVNRNSKVYAIFVDFKAAFDSIDHELLWHKLQGFGLSSKFLNILRSFYSQATAAIKCNDSLTPTVAITRGVLQGEVLSPLLFSLFLADLETFLLEKGCHGLSINSAKEVVLLAYADDLVLLANTPTEVNRKLTALAEYCAKFSLTVNTSKTNIVIFRKNRCRVPFEYFNFAENEKIKVVDSYVYLGTTFHRNCRFDISFDKTMSNCKFAITTALRTIDKLKITAWQDINTIFDSLIASIALYGAEVCGPSKADSFEKIQNLFFKRLLKLPLNCPTHALRLEIGRCPLKVFIFKAILQWIRRLSEMDNSRYPKLCFLELCKLRDRHSSYANNWVCEIKHFFSMSDSIDSWLSIGVSVPDSLEILNRYSRSMRLHDRLCATASHSLVLYNFVTPHEIGKAAPYLLLNDLSLPHKANYARLRLLSSYNKSLMIFNKFLQFENEFCKFCNCHIDIFILHCASECEKLNLIKSTEFPALCPDLPILFTLNSCDRLIICDICNFLSRCCEL